MSSGLGSPSSVDAGSCTLIRSGFGFRIVLRFRFSFKCRRGFMFKLTRRSGFGFRIVLRFRFSFSLKRSRSGFGRFTFKSRFGFRFKLERRFRFNLRL